MTRSPLSTGVGAGLRACLVAGLVMLAGCATTTDAGAPTITAVGDTEPPTTALPVELPAQLDEIVTLATGMGDEIAEEGSTEDTTLLEVQAIWDSAGPVISGTDPALFREFEHQLGILAGGVEKNRPADADKAARNLAVVTEAYLAKYPS